MTSIVANALLHELLDGQPSSYTRLIGIQLHIKTVSRADWVLHPALQGNQFVDNRLASWEYLPTLATTAAKSGLNLTATTFPVTLWGVRSAVHWRTGNSVTLTLARARFGILSEHFHSLEVLPHKHGRRKEDTGGACAPRFGNLRFCCLLLDRKMFFS